MKIMIKMMSLYELPERNSTNILNWLCQIKKQHNKSIWNRPNRRTIEGYQLKFLTKICSLWSH